MMVDAALFAVREIMEDDEACIFYGQDVGRRLGGVFREAATLAEQFGDADERPHVFLRRRRVHDDAGCLRRSEAEVATKARVCGCRLQIEVARAEYGRKPLLELFQSGVLRRCLIAGSATAASSATAALASAEEISIIAFERKSMRRWHNACGTIDNGTSRYEAATIRVGDPGDFTTSNPNATWIETFTTSEVTQELGLGIGAIEGLLSRWVAMAPEDIRRIAAGRSLSGRAGARAGRSARRSRGGRR